MAPSQQYDEGGDMASYFLITLLALILLPLSISQGLGILRSFQAPRVEGCRCSQCIAQRRASHRKKDGSSLKPKVTNKGIILTVGWALFLFLAYRTAGIESANKIYNPFEILGLSSDSTIAEIKSHYKKLSKIYHPDKYKGNATTEEVERKFIEITKGYKSLTDETIRQNLAEWGNPDGRMSPEVALAIPKYLVEGKNSIWVLVAYGLVFGLLLPVLVGRWWFGSREKTKDGVNARTAAAFFKSVKEEGGLDNVLGSLGLAYSWESLKTPKKAEAELLELEAIIKGKISGEWDTLARQSAFEQDDKRRVAMILLYTHLLRIPITSSELKAAQQAIVLQTPMLLNSLLTVTTARNWLSPSLAIMRLGAFITQALKPTENVDQVKMAQLPWILESEVMSEKRVEGRETLQDRYRSAEEKNDPRKDDMKQAVQSWGQLDCVDASFKVIGEKIITPSSIVHLVVKLRVVDPSSLPLETNVDVSKDTIKANERKDEEFLRSGVEAEEIPAGTLSEYPHAPFWPCLRKPSWWLVLADNKTNRVVVPPFKISDIPPSRPSTDRNYRSFKMQFQAPPNVGLYTWKLHVVSDTFVGEEVIKPIALKIEEPSADADDLNEDDISDPEEDSLAGQMAAMRGGSVKRSLIHADDDESDDESGTDDEESESDSDSDSD